MKQSLEFSYKLSYEECYETFLLLSMKWSKKVKTVVGVLLTLITVGLMIAYYLDSQKIHYFVMVIFAICLLYYLIYVPVLKAKRGAAKVSKKNGNYRVKLTSDGKIISEAETIALADDKEARAIETEKLFVLRPDNRHTFCLPKRIMKNDEVEAVREIVKANVKYQVR